ncbi:MULTISPECIES: hypothetical protein [Methylocaldum]|jgi:hypothetical protein|uniref:hypothetical protein n=1 Tax=unclassified Methylocaldum TaxID=2622260 RepID=UPI0010D7E14B|nr:hypothetical protein [Methylocaldum sp. 14B]
MCTYENRTDVAKIEKQIDRSLQDEGKAKEVLREIAQLCLDTKRQPDYMSQWLSLLRKKGIDARKLAGKNNYVEIYPSGTHGKGKSDRLLFQVEETWVEVVEAGESTHGGALKLSAVSTMSLAELDQIIAAGPHAALDAVLATDQSAFQDSDGLISFVNMSSSFVTSNPEYKTGREVCDKVSNFFATLRIKVFGYLQKNPGKVLPGDSVPKTQWDAAVTHYMQFLLTQAGGLTNYRVTTETYSVTQVITEFSTSLIKLLFDAAAAPESIVSDVVKFVQGVGQSLRASWDDKSRHYATALLGQCHEAVPVDASDQTTVYFPKIKYYYISVDSSQHAFTSSCATVEKLTFDFKYEYYVTGLKASILDPTSDDYKQFVAFLDKAQAVSYQDANNNLDAILDNTVSDEPATSLEFSSDPSVNVFGVDLTEYPRVAIKPPRTIERVLNRHARSAS